MTGKMAKNNITVSITGKGGVGKTVITGFLLNYLLKKRQNILVVDADPATNLGDILNISIEKTVGKIVDEAKEYVERKSDQYDGPAYLEYRIWEVISKYEGFDLLSMGKSVGSGCYCAINAVLKHILDYLKTYYSIILVDMEAGLEHFSRRTDRPVDIMFIIVDPSQMALHTAERILTLIKEVNLEFKQVFLVGNKYPDDQVKPLGNFCKEKMINFLGVIPPDMELQYHVLRNESILDFASNLKSYQIFESLIKQNLNSFSS